MTIKEFIEKLSKLEQDKNIWVNYDAGYAIFEPEIEKVTKNEKDMFYEHQMNEGDYVINAW